MSQKNPSRPRARARPKGAVEADIRCRWEPVADFENKARIECVHAGVRQIAHRLGRLLSESDNETGGVDIDNTAL